MLSSVIMFESGDNRAPDDYMQLVLKDYNKCWSAAVVDLKNSKAGAIIKKETPPSLTEINDFRALCSAEGDQPNLALVYWFAKSDKPIHEDDYQPFVVLKDEEDNPLVIAFVSGALKRYQGEGSAISNEFYYSMEYLQTQMEMLYEQTGKDIEKLDNVLDRDAVEKSLNKSLGNDPATMFLVIADEARSCRAYGSSEKLNEFDWGFTSDRLGWEEVPFEEEKSAKVEEKKPLSFAERLAAKESKPAAAPVTKSTTTVSVGSGPSDKLRPPKGATPDSHPQWFTQFPPSKVQHAKKKDVERYYEKLCGKAPNNAMECPWMQRLSPAQSGISTEPIKSFEGLTKIANTEPVSKSSGPPVLTAQDTKWLNEQFIPEYFDAANKKIKNPFTYTEVEDKYPTLQEVTGLGDVMLGMPTVARERLLKEHPKAFINWSFAMTKEISTLKNQVSTLLSKVNEKGARDLKKA